MNSHENILQFSMQMFVALGTRKQYNCDSNEAQPEYKKKSLFTMFQILFRLELDEIANLFLSTIKIIFISTLHSIEIINSIGKTH